MWPLGWLSSAHHRIWPGPREGADSAALLGAGFPGSQEQWAGLTCESLVTARGLGWLQKGPVLLTQSALGLTHSPKLVPRRMRRSEGVSPLPWAPFCYLGESKQGPAPSSVQTLTHQLSTHTQHKDARGGNPPSDTHTHTQTHSELSLGTHRHKDIQSRRKKAQPRCTHTGTEANTPVHAC